MKQDRNDIRELLSARLRRVRKGPPGAHLRLVSENQTSSAAGEHDAIADADAQAVAAANALSAASAVFDPEFGSRVGSLTRMDALCANQTKQSKQAKRKHD